MYTYKYIYIYYVDPCNFMSIHEAKLYMCVYI